MRVLALHGYHMNANIMIKMSYSLVKRLDHNIELIVPDAPFSVKPYRPEITKYYDPPFYKWVNGKNINFDDLKNLNNIDGIIGFSQGAYIAYLLHSYINPKFIINISGVNHCNITTEKINIPSIHIIGEKDSYYLKSLELTNKYNSPEIIYHKDGHHFPKNIDIYKKINFFINNNI